MAEASRVRVTRKFDGTTEWHAGLDLGVASVGWAAIDDEGKLFHVNRKPTLGTRLFSEAQTAEGRRLTRSQRRRLARRNRRMRKLDELFMPEMSKVDPEFFVRMHQSPLLADDRDPSHDTRYTGLLFGGDGSEDAEFNHAYPTVFHLRKHLMESDEKADIRAIWVAMHNMMKHRGNFLYETAGDFAGASSLDPTATVTVFVDALTSCEGLGAPVSPDIDAVTQVVCDTTSNRKERVIRLSKALHCDKAAIGKTIATACLGGKIRLARLFPDWADEKVSISFADDEALGEQLSKASADDVAAAMAAIGSMNALSILYGLLQGRDTISDAMVALYEEHHCDLKALKRMTRIVGDDEYERMFGSTSDGAAHERVSYTAYVGGWTANSNAGKPSEDELRAAFKKLLSGNETVEADPEWAGIKAKLDDDSVRFLPKPRSRFNGTIPYQLHLSEMEAIIDRQGKHYPFLEENRDLLKAILSTRIPYYVGPLNAALDPLGSYAANKVDPTRAFGWSARKPGHEGDKVDVWTYADSIDLPKSAERFIRRMTGTCSYVIDEPVLPRHSLLYEEYTFWNEIATVKWRHSGETRWHRLDDAQRSGIWEDLVVAGRASSLTTKAIATWIASKETTTRRKAGVGIEVSGTQKKDRMGFVVTSRHDLLSDLGAASIDESPLSTEELEKVVLWATVFEDAGMRRNRIHDAFGERLSDRQLDRLSRRRYSGWGSMSKRFLTEVTVPRKGLSGVVENLSIMDILREGNPLARQRGRKSCGMNLMQVLNDKDLGFRKALDAVNADILGHRSGMLSVDELPGSPALRRSVNQAMRILDELTRIFGCPPASIAIENTRDASGKGRGRETKRRYDQLREGLVALDSQVDAILEELDEHQESVDRRKLYLYFAQGGRCAYTGEHIALDRLDTVEYQVDHVIPQCYTDDDSMGNIVLVKADANQRKLDDLLLDSSIIKRMRPTWESWVHAGLMSQRKYANLTRTEINDAERARFVARQLVETSQVVAFVRMMCEQRYPDARVVGIKPGIGSGIRHLLRLPKIREANDYHHAFDALLAAEASLFVSKVYPAWAAGELEASETRRIMREFAKRQAENVAGDGSKSATGRRPGDGGRPSGTFWARRRGNVGGFLANEFTRRHFDLSTGEVFWDGEGLGDYLCKVYEYKNMPLTRMVEWPSGAFWDATLYSPNSGKAKIGVGKKHQVDRDDAYRSDLPVDRYGGYNSVKSAYGTLWQHDVIKQGKEARMLEYTAIPVYVARMVDEGQMTLAEYLAEEYDVPANAISFIRKKIGIRQTVMFNGELYYINSLAGSIRVKPLQQPVYNRTVMNQIAEALHTGSIDIDTASNVVTALLKHVSGISPRTHALLQGLTDDSHAFLSDDERQALDKLRSLMNYAKNSYQARSIDLSSVGGAKTAGDIKIQANTLFTSVSTNTIVFVDYSITGLFSYKKTVIGT